MDVHERPFISSEDESPLRAGDDLHRRAVDHHPRPLRAGIEDIVVCEEGGGRTLNSYPTALVANG